MANGPIPVLYFSNSVVRGGAEEHILTLLRQLDRRLFRPHLVCPRECGEKLKADLPEDVHLILLSFQKPYELRGALRLARILRQENIGILHSHLFGASLAASPIGRMFGVPVIMETPHVREAWRHGLIKGHYVVDRIVGRCVDHYVAVSEANARFLVQKKGLPARKVHVIHNGCDLKRFDPERLAPPGMKQSLGFAEEDPVILVLGRLEPQKGHRFLLEAHARVVRQFPKARLVCLGEGALREDLEEQTRHLQIQESVRFVGYQSNITEWLAMANFTVLPSLYEGLPLVAIESLAAQRPMVATAVDGTAEVVVNDKTGLTVPPGDARELAQAILRLLRQPELRHQLALTGRQWVLENFSQEQQIRKTQELYLRAWKLSSRRAKRRTMGRISEEADECVRAAPIEQTLSAPERR
jgi:glycosyltransferase involved in cell wall biosynthesis